MIALMTMLPPSFFSSDFGIDFDIDIDADITFTAVFERLTDGMNGIARFTVNNYEL